MPRNITNHGAILVAFLVTACVVLPYWQSSSPSSRRMTTTTAGSANLSDSSSTSEWRLADAAGVHNNKTLTLDVVTPLTVPLSKRDISVEESNTNYSVFVNINSSRWFVRRRRDSSKYIWDGEKDEQQQQEKPALSQRESGSGAARGGGFTFSAALWSAVREVGPGCSPSPRHQAAFHEDFIAPVISVSPCFQRNGGGGDDGEATYKEVMCGCSALAATVEDVYLFVAVRRDVFEKYLAVSMALIEVHPGGGGLVPQTAAARRQLASQTDAMWGVIDRTSLQLTFARCGAPDFTFALFKSPYQDAIRFLEERKRLHHPHLSPPNEANKTVSMRVLGKGVGLSPVITPSAAGAAAASAVSSSSTDEVFYAIQPDGFFPGHALENLLSALAQYYASGLDQRGVPWLIPRLGSSVAKLSHRGHAPKAFIFSVFFHQLNAYLGLPYVEVTMERYEPNHPQPPLMHFRKVIFSNYEMGRNFKQCVHPTLRNVLWPHAVRAFNATYQATMSSVNLSASSSRGRAVAFLKLAQPNSGAMTAVRAFHQSLTFQELCQKYGVEQYDPQLPLLERMFLLNSAELVVTTWGAAAATSMHLMIPRNHWRLLVIVHYGYWYEATYLLRHTDQREFNVFLRRHFDKFPRLVYTIHDRVSFHEGGFFDYAAEGFCARFVFVKKLGAMRHSDFTFHCDSGVVRNATSPQSVPTAKGARKKRSGPR